MSASIRVLVADDSAFICRLLTTYLASVPGFEVVGTALNGQRAFELAKQLLPDVVTLDLEMPEMDGLQALEKIMQEAPTAVVMISGVSRQAAAATLQALESGAVDFILKYSPGLDTNPEALRLEIINKVRAASQVKVIRSLRQRTLAQAAEIESAPPASYSALLPYGVVVIGASTGGPVALRELLGALPRDFPAALVIVQHMPPTFTGVLAAQLQRLAPLPVKEAQPGDRLQAGQALVAPGGYHLLLRPDGRVELNQGPEIKGQRPSVDVTMQSAALVFGARTVGVVLTGMGDDGAQGLVAIHSKGGKTFAQDAASCVVNGMPQRAIERGVVDRVASPDQIGRLLRAAVPSRPGLQERISPTLAKKELP